LGDKTGRSPALSGARSISPSKQPRKERVGRLRIVENWKNWDDRLSVDGRGEKNAVRVALVCKGAHPREGNMGRKKKKKKTIHLYWVREVGGECKRVGI